MNNPVWEKMREVRGDAQIALIAVEMPRGAARGIGAKSKTGDEERTDDALQRLF
ncbi:MAG: hypothetical protein ACR2IL_06310 [Chitinophagaceae bacterium]